MKTRFQGPEASPGFLMWRAALAWQRDIAAALEPVGLTHSQFVLLACTQWLEEHGDGASQVMVATQAGMDVKTASQVLRRLEGAGLVSRLLDYHFPAEGEMTFIKDPNVFRDLLLAYRGG